MDIEEAYEPEHRQAARAFLQRADVRLSTMHRIAGVFLNGAGLLVLFPIVFRDSVSQIIGMLASAPHAAAAWQSSAILFCLAISFLISIGLPLAALYYLLKDLVLFYFVGHVPGYADKAFLPRFALTGLAFPPDESPEMKEHIFRYQYATDLIKFILPFHQDLKFYYDGFDETNVPSTRRLDDANPLVAELKVAQTGQDDKKDDINRFNIALGLAGFLDRPIAEEVAKAEVSLARHALYLRRLVLRYTKALMLLIWTTLVSFFQLALAKSLANFSVPILAGGYLIWALLSMNIISLPIRWLYGHSNQNARKVADPELKKFELMVRVCAIITVVMSVATLYLSCKGYRI